MGHQEIEAIRGVDGDLELRLAPRHLEFLHEIGGSGEENTSALRLIKRTFGRQSPCLGPTARSRALARESESVRPWKNRSASSQIGRCRIGWSYKKIASEPGRPSDTVSLRHHE